MTRRVVVIGGGAAGMSAASAARRVDPSARVTVLESGPYAGYGVCGLPYFLGGTVKHAESLIAMPPEDFRGRRGIDLRLETPVLGVDPEGRTVELPTEKLPFDRLVLATGAQPLVPPLARLDDPRVVTVRRLDDAIGLRARLPQVRRAVVVGAGYVGLETAESLCEQGIDVCVVDRLPRVMPTVDESIAEIVREEVARHAELLLGRSLTALDVRGDSIVVDLSGEQREADLVVLALGVTPNVGLLPGAAAGPSGALLVDERMRTSLPGVLAAGDCVAVHHRITGGPAYVPLGPAANKTGRVAGTVAVGGEAVFPGVVGTAVVKVFDLTVAHTGLTLEQAHAAGMEAIATDITAKSRAKYYPGTAPLTVRLVHGSQGALLGAQLVGRDGAAKRVDVVAAALHAGFSIHDLADLDLAYAPPYAPVYDPLLQAAQAAQRRLRRDASAGAA